MASTLSENTIATLKVLRQSDQGSFLDKLVLLRLAMK